MIQYQNLIASVYQQGDDRTDRTGTGTRSSFGHKMVFDLQDGFPLVTIKRTNMTAVVKELLWFLSGSTNVKDLGCGIWDAWAREDGDLGPIYGKQWSTQIDPLLEGLRNDPHSRRHIVSSWNVAELPKMALAPCHAFFQCHVSFGGRLDLQVYQRSADLLLGVPFNIASYALLTHMLAQQCGYQPGRLIWTGGDCHIYHNHLHAVPDLMNRTPKPLPDLLLAPAPTIYDYRLENVRVDNYYPHPAVALPVAV